MTYSIYSIHILAVAYFLIFRKTKSIQYKCGVMITNGHNQLEMVSSYKYLGVDLNNELDSFMLFTRVSGLIKPNIYLLKQLKSSGLKERILVNVFKSLVLSHLRYSSVILDSCTTAAKNDMQVIQNLMLRIIC